MFPDNIWAAFCGSPLHPQHSCKNIIDYNFEADYDLSFFVFKTFFLLFPLLQMIFFFWWGSKIEILIFGLTSNN